MNELQVEHEAELDVNATPAPVSSSEDDFDADKWLKHSHADGLAIAAEHGSMDDWRTLREHDMAVARREKLDPERAKENERIWGAINSVKEVRAQSEAAIQNARAAQEEVERYGLQNVHDRERHAEIRGHAKALVGLYEEKHPGHREAVAATFQAYGGLAPHVERTLAASPLYPELMEVVCNFPEMIAVMNAESPEDLRVRVAVATNELQRERGQRREQQYQPVPARPSAAPPPVKTITGKSHATRPTLEDASYDEYKAMRMREINKRR
jgi:hypothetical protein